MRALLMGLTLALYGCVGIYADDRQTSVITPLGVFTEDRAASGIEP